MDWRAHVRPAGRDHGSRPRASRHCMVRGQRSQPTLPANTPGQHSRPKLLPNADTSWQKTDSFGLVYAHPTPHSSPVEVLYSSYGHAMQLPQMELQLRRLGFLPGPLKTINKLEKSIWLPDHKDPFLAAGAYELTGGTAALASHTSSHGGGPLQACSPTRPSRPRPVPCPRLRLHPRPLPLLAPSPASLALARAVIATRCRQGNAVPRAQGQLFPCPRRRTASQPQCGRVFPILQPRRRCGACHPR